MRRFLGSGKKKAPPPSLGDASKVLDLRVNTLDQKIQKLDVQLLETRKQMQKARKGGPGHRRAKGRAMQILRQKRMYENQRDSLMGQQFTLEQTSFAQQQMKDTVTTVAAMKEANVQLKKEFKHINVDDVEDMQDDMAELFEDTQDIQEAMGRTYGLPEDIDESELEAELADLEDDIALEETEGAMEEIPFYLQAPAVPTTELVPPREEVATEERTVAVDEYGLPAQ